MTQMTIGAATHPGKRKTENEDSYDVVLPEGDTQDRKGILLILADGMGGHAGGAVASRTAVDVVMEQYLNTPAGDVLEALRAAFQKANAAVLEKSARDRSVAGMATTLTAVVIKDDLLFHAHVGDSGPMLSTDRIWLRSRKTIPMSPAWWPQVRSRRQKRKHTRNAIWSPGPWEPCRTWPSMRPGFPGP
ncbi:hypothetical protein D3OALGB2SA_3301 [Olavius algarvensis associated proteobacterium Delta 3]|nr:hypothetical protein D3OALGB2SA_3301 [Olavius algarvensis associated proteobacterium Delta 3]